MYEKDWKYVRQLKEISKLKKFRLKKFKILQNSYKLSN